MGHCWAKPKDPSVVRPTFDTDDTARVSHINDTDNVRPGPIAVPDISSATPAIINKPTEGRNVNGVNQTSITQSAIGSSSAHNDIAIQNKDTATDKVAVTSVSENKSADENPTAVRRFNQSWLKLWPWLQFDGTKMYCKTCVSARKENYMTVGCTTFKTSSMTRHENTADHKSLDDAPLIKKIWRMS